MGFHIDILPLSKRERTFKVPILVP